MKRILGLDLGTASIGWALVNEAESENETSSIEKLGVRIIQYDNFNKVDKTGKVSESKNPVEDFKIGKGLSPNAKRTQQRGARRNLQRFKLRRKYLLNILIENKFIDKNTPLTEVGEHSTHQLLQLRAKAANSKVKKEEFARVLLAINKKRGYKSSRKAKNEEEGNLIDGMAVAKELYDNSLTPGQYVHQLISNGKKYIPDFYQSDLQNEFDLIWNYQKQYYSDILSSDLYKNLQGKNKTQTWAICQKPFNIVGVKLDGKAKEQKAKKYELRALAINNKIELEHLAIVLQEINNNLNKSSGYLGAISDRSKILYFDNLTVGQYLYQQIQSNPHKSLKNQVFYRQDYLDEFEKIWETQKKYHPELTDELKSQIRDVVIFYQHKLKSQKGLISLCELESFRVEIPDSKKTKLVGPRVIPKSSPLFQESKIWQNINILVFTNKKTKENKTLSIEDKNALFHELNIRGNFSKKEIFNYLELKEKDWEVNLKEGIEGNRTFASLYNVYQRIAEEEGYGFDWNKKSAIEILEELQSIFPQIGINKDILDFNSNKDLDSQLCYQLWHILYSAEDDVKSISKKDQNVYGKSNVNLQKKLHQKFGFKPKYAKMLCNISLQQDYGNLSAKALKKITPHLKDGHEYSKAAALAGYNHSNSKSKKELEKRILKPKLDILKKNSLRNPVVEKILNQMVNVVNQIIDVYGKPDEVRIELSRDLKNSAKQRSEMTTYIIKAKKRHDDIRKILQQKFGLKNPTRNDLIKYKLYEELASNGYKTLYTNKYIEPKTLFTKEIDIEHIIPKARLFDDSFSNKTLAFRKPNQEKGNMTAIDYMEEFQQANLDNYKSTIETLFKNGDISKAKLGKLLMKQKDIPEDFIERDLRNSQYIAKKAKELLEEVVRTVNTTTGKITNELRRDWDLINVMKELNLPKYQALGLTKMEERKNGVKIEKIIDWTKRNDHRHHAMDALTVAFTTYNHIQYLNNLNAASNKDSKFYSLKNKITKFYESKNGNSKRKFIPPIENFRTEAKSHIESILISFKAKNKVVTRNTNKTKVKGSKTFNKKTQLTPRGQLHKETIYGKINRPVIKEEKVSSKFDLEKISHVCNPNFKEALLTRLKINNDNPKKAFTGKNAIAKNPIILKNGTAIPEKVKTQYFEEIYTIRKPITYDLKVEKVIDKRIQKILKSRLLEFDNNAKLAFSNLDDNPIFLDKKNEITIKNVTITGVSSVEALHHKKDHLGKTILSENNQPIPSDFVSTGNNHHVAIYRDSDGNLHEKVVSFFEAVARKNVDLPIIDKRFNHELGWQFLFTMKQNEMFIFRSEDFNPNENDLIDTKNNKKISQHLFRVQKFTNRDYFFRHHLETNVDNIKATKDKLWKRVGLNGINNILKVRINHLGQIVQVGEY